MVDFASLPIPVLPYTPVHRPGIGIAVTTSGHLRRTARLEVLAAPHRLDFHQIVLVTQGTGRFSVDSTRFECRPGCLLWIRPNQVIQTLPGPDLDADVIMFTEAFPLRMNAHMEMLDDVLRPSHWRLSERELAEFRQVLDILGDEFRRSDRALGEDVLKHLLAVLLLHIDDMCRTHHEDQSAHADLNDENGALFLRFRRELDSSFRSTRRVEDYAVTLDCTARTLARACRAVAGTSTKDLIDARVALEARRLLVHSDLPIGAIARQLGFSEVTNFTKFFIRRVNMTPGAFRRDHRMRNNQT
jgi:AraC-like DNA-binding protein